MRALIWGAPEGAIGTEQSLVLGREKQAVLESLESHLKTLILTPKNGVHSGKDRAFWEPILVVAVSLVVLLIAINILAFDCWW